MYKGPSIYNSGTGFSPGDIVDGLIFGSGFAAETLSAATCEGSYTVTGANNSGAVTGTFLTIPVGMVLRKLGAHLLQGLGDTGFRLIVYIRAGVAVARTAKFNFPTDPALLGERFYPIVEKYNATLGTWEASDNVILEGGVGYYFGIFCPQISSGARFLGKDAGTSFGVKPWLSWTVDNVGTDAPNVLGTMGYESTIRYMVMGATA